MFIHTLYSSRIKSCITFHPKHYQNRTFTAVLQHLISRQRSGTLPRGKLRAWSDSWPFLQPEHVISVMFSFYNF